MSLRPAKAKVVVRQNTNKKAGSVVQVVEHLCNKHENSIPGSTEIK
jgi:hypothetical protein